MKIVTVSLLISALCAVPAVADNGGGAYEFLTIPSSARAFGLGGCNISLIGGDAAMSGQNPALLGPEINSQLTAGYMRYMGSANFANAGFAHSAGEHSAWGISARYMNYGELSGYDESGAFTGTFTPTDLVIEGTYSHDFNDRLRGGINIKAISNNYEQYSAFAIAADLGINWYDPDHDLSASAVLKNMGGQLKRFDRVYDKLPFDLQLGLSKGLGESFSLSVTALHLTKWDLPYYTHPSSTEASKESEIKSGFAKNLFRHLVFGLEYLPSESFYLDLGYNYKTRTDMGNYQRNFFSGFSAGIGFRARALSVGAAYAMPHKSASTLMLNLALDL